MAGFGLLLKDEFNGFMKSKVMLALWIGMPLFTILFNYLKTLSPEAKAGPEQLAASLGIAIIIAGTAGVLASLVLAINIIHENNRNVFELFLVRPIKRIDIILSKFFAVFSSVVMASVISLLIGIAYDILTENYLLELAFKMFSDELLKYLITILTTIAISCSAGILIGIITNSVLVGVILIFFISSNLAFVIPFLPFMLQMDSPLLWTNIFGYGSTIIILYLSKIFFDRKQF